MRKLVAAFVFLAVAAAGCASDPDKKAASMHKWERDLPILVRGPRAVEPDAYFVFAYFKEPATSMYVAVSRDGYAWKQVGDRPVLETSLGLRDPSIARDKDGVYHMLATGGGPGRIIYSQSRDLLHWSEARPVEVPPAGPHAKGVWAPELVWDEDQGHWFIAFSTEAEPQGKRELGTNHRIYHTTTTDFVTLAPPKPLLETGYQVIDPAFLKEGGTWHLFFKDERGDPPMKQLRMTSGPSLRGPWGEISPAFTIRMVEAPAAIKLGGDYVVYFDEFDAGRYGAVRSEDLKEWHDVSKLMTFPQGARHGTVLRVPPEIGRRLVEVSGGEEGTRLK